MPESPPPLSVAPMKDGNSDSTQIFAIHARVLEAVTLAFVQQTERSVTHGDWRSHWEMRLRQGFKAWPTAVFE